MAFASLTIDLNARLANLERDLGKVAHQAEKESQRMQAAFAKAGSAATALAGALGVGSFFAFVKGSIDAADNLNDLSKKTGIAVENLAGLQLVVDKSGTTMEMLGGGVAKLNKTLGEAAAGSKSAQTILRDLGITATDPMEAFYQLADAFGRFKTEGDKANAMSQVIGKTWGELAPALAEGGDGMRKMVEEGKRLNPVTQEMAEQADKFNDALSRMKVEVNGFGTTIGAQILPAMNAWMEQMNEGIRIFGSFGAAFNNIGLGISPLNSLTENLAKYRKEIADLEKFRASAGAGADESFFRSVDARLDIARKKLEFLKAMQRQEALALNDQYGTGNYKLPGAPAPKKISITPYGSGKSAQAKGRMSDAEWAMEEAAYMTRTLYQIATEMDAAREAAFDRATESAQEWEDGQDRAREKLEALRAEMIDLIDPVQKYRDKLEEIDLLLENKLLTPEQATAARLYWQEQIDAAAGFGAQLKTIESEWDVFSRTAAESMQSALADFLFDPFKDGLKGMLYGFAQTVQRMAAEAIAANLMKSLFGDSGGQNLLGSFASLFGFAKGGVMTGAGPLALNRYASGGVANRPQLALFGEGRTPEAYVPLPDGRSIPVRMQGMPSLAQNHIRIVNAFDVSVVGDYLGSTAGEQIILNTVRRNAGALRSVLA